MNFLCLFFFVLFFPFFFCALAFHSHRRCFSMCVCQCFTVHSHSRLENTHVNRHFAIFFCLLQCGINFRFMYVKKNDEMIHEIECQYTINWNDRALCNFRKNSHKQSLQTLLLLFFVVVVNGAV